MENTPFTDRLSAEQERWSHEDFWASDWVRTLSDRDLHGLRRVAPRRDTAGVVLLLMSMEGERPAENQDWSRPDNPLERLGMICALEALRRKKLLDFRAGICRGMEFLRLTKKGSRLRSLDRLRYN